LPPFASNGAPPTEQLVSLDCDDGTSPVLHVEPVVVHAPQPHEPFFDFGSPKPSVESNPPGQTSVAAPNPMGVNPAAARVMPGQSLFDQSGGKRDAPPSPFGEASFPITAPSTVTAPPAPPGPPGDGSTPTTLIPQAPTASPNGRIS
jgi:hypothetical protein